MFTRDDLSQRPILLPARSTGAGLAPSTRAVAIDHAVRMRTLHRSLAQEFADVAPPGQVLALSVRCATALKRGGCASGLIAEATERMVRAALAARTA